MHSESLLRQNERTAFRLVDGQAVIVTVDAQKLHVLNSVGTRVWELCDGRSMADIVETIVNEFEVDFETARNDVQRFLDELIALGAVETREKYGDGRVSE